MWLVGNGRFGFRMNYSILHDEQDPSVGFLTTVVRGVIKILRTFVLKPSNSLVRRNSERQ